jgi:hypothetical protein
MRDMALSVNTPVGLPLASFSIFPPGGTNVFLSIQACFNAQLLTQRR